jgi:hypothetical protein
MWNWHKRVFWDQEIFAFCKSSSHNSSGWIPTSSAKVFFQETSAWYRTLAASQNEYLPQVSRQVEGRKCKIGQLSHRLPIPYVPVIDIIMPKEEPQIFKVKLPDASHLSMSIYSCGNNKEYLAHIIAVLQIINQKQLPKRCRILAKAVVRRSEVLKNLQEAAGSKDTVLTNVDVTVRKVKIEQIQQMLQEAQRAHNKAIADTYKQLRNLLSGDAQSQWDCIYRKMHERDLWAAVNGQVIKGRHPQTWMSFLDCLELHKCTVFSADVAKRQRFDIQQAVCKPQRATVLQHIL